jgi:pterin-4a-carbinolamine dehydratase
VSLSTHDEGGVTERDLALAREVEGTAGSELDAG